VTPEYGVRRSSSVFTEKWTYVSQVTLAACGPGYYRPVDNCVEVGLGYYSPDQDNERYECGGNNYYCPTTTNTAPTTVSAGYYSTGGTSSTRTGQSQCTAGTYCVNGEQNAASIGYYVPEAGATSQTGCSAGTYTGSTGQTSCSTCTAGYRCPGSSDRIACSAGTYQPNTGQSSCVSASAGYYVSGTTATSQTECGGNDYYCPGTGNTGPTTVSSGYYSTGGTASTRTGQSICEAGNYCVSGVKYACGTCKNSSEGATSCYNVSAGTSGYGCTDTHYRCNGSGSCTAPLVYPCVRTSYNMTGNTACSNGGYLGCSGGYFSTGCSGDAYSCASGQTCNGGLCSAKCWEYQYDNGKTYGCVTWGWGTTGQTACTNAGWGGFIGVHAWVSGCSGAPQAYYSSCGDDWCGTVTCWRK
jgi:hypothetical protein